MSQPLTFVYEDASLVAVEKPSGLLSVPGRTPDKQDCVISRLKSTGLTPYVVHRLDRDTSGILLVALDVATQRKLNRDFENRAVEKFYTAIVAGRVTSATGIIDAPIRKDEAFQLPPKYKVDHAFGKPAITYWSLQSAAGDDSVLCLRPKTGRSHQLRVHCQSMGHPIVGDPIYGSVPGSRLMLHASEIRLAHPKTDALLHLKSTIELSR